MRITQPLGMHAWIIRDRVFGTFQRGIGPIAHDLTTGHCSYNPVRLMLGPPGDWAKGEFARERDLANRLAAPDR